MKKSVKLLVVAASVLAILILTLVIGFICMSAKIEKEAAELKNVPLDISQIADGVYEGHSELGPVVVDVKVSVEKGTILEVDIIKHENGLGQPANAIAEVIADRNTYEVDAVSGATVSSRVIINAVNKALQKGL